MDNPISLVRRLGERLETKRIARSFGYFFFGTGVLLLLLIIYAMATRLMR